MNLSAEIKIRYRDFWPGFNAADCLFTHLVAQISGKTVKIVTNPSEYVDLQFDSTFSLNSLRSKLLLRSKGIVSNDAYVEYISRSDFGFRPQKAENCRTAVWYTGENKRPPTKNYDAYLTFEKTDKRGKNLYFPYWMLRVNWGFTNSEYELTPMAYDLAVKRSATTRPFAACQFSGTGSPSRIRLVEIVNDYLPVDSYGKYNEKQVRSKKTTAEQYGFQICSENDLYPGYVTEKLQEAWITQNVPIWEGLHCREDFNKKAYIDLTGLSTDEIVNRIQSLTIDEMYSIQEEPLLKVAPDLTEITHLLSGLL